MSKICMKCKSLVPLSMFSKCVSNRDGIQNYCKSCMREYRNNSTDESKKKKIAYIARTKALKSIYDAENYKKNKDSIIEYQKKYYLENKEKVLARIKEYQNTDFGKLTKRNTKLKRRSVIKQSSISTKDMKHSLSEAKKCYWCGVAFTKAIQKQIDHYTPIHLGGEHSAENIVISCPNCNKVKSAKDPINYAHSIGRLL